MFVFEKVRSKRFPWAWSLLHCFQAPLLLIGMPVNRFVDWYVGPKSSLVLSVILIFIGSFIMILIDVLKRRYKERRRTRHKVTLESEAAKNEGKTEPMRKDEDDIEEVIDDVAGEYERRNSLPDGDDDFLPPLTLMTQQRSVTYGDLVDGNNQRVTYISEVRWDRDNFLQILNLISSMFVQEAMADLNFPEKILEELECLENMTSCHKVRMHH